MTLPSDHTICLGESATLDASGIDLVNCTGLVEHAWRDGAVVVGTAASVDVSPATTTTYEDDVSCSTDPACAATFFATVEVQAPPLFAVASARDLADCNLGVELTWDAAVFLDPSASGTYNVYRSEVDCTDALARPPMAVGHGGTAWFDVDTRHGATYHYVVEAEDARVGTACLPVGPGNGGVVTRACLGSVLEVAVPTTPDGVDATLRMTHDGHAVTAHWAAARGLLAGEHFHLLKGVNEPTSTFTMVNPAGDVARSFTEVDPSAVRQFFDLRVANACEVQSVDEYPPG